MIRRLIEQHLEKLVVLTAVAVLIASSVLLVTMVPPSPSSENPTTTCEIRWIPNWCYIIGQDGIIMAYYCPIPVSHCEAPP